MLGVSVQALVLGAGHDGMLVAAADLGGDYRGIEEDTDPPNGVGSALVAGSLLTMVSPLCSPSDEMGSSGTTVKRRGPDFTRIKSWSDSSSINKHGRNSRICLEPEGRITTAYRPER